MRSASGYTDSEQFKGFNKEELRRVARVLTLTNKHVSRDVRSVMEHIARLTRTSLPYGVTSYFETLGFCVTGYFVGNDTNGEWCYKVTLSSYGIEQFIETGERA